MGKAPHKAFKDPVICGAPPCTRMANAESSVSIYLYGPIFMIDMLNPFIYSVLDLAFFILRRYTRYMILQASWQTQQTVIMR